MVANPSVAIMLKRAHVASHAPCGPALWAGVQLRSDPYACVWNGARAHVEHSMQQYDLCFLHDRRDLLVETAELINREWPRSLAARPV